MRTAIFIILTMAGQVLFAADQAEKEVKSEVSEVTVFLKGAQVTRVKTLDLPQGKQILKFNGLSPYIDGKSVQASAEGEIMILSVNHQQNYLSDTKKPEEVSRLEKLIKDTDESINMERTMLNVVAQELAFLQENRVIGGRDQEVSVTNLKDASEFYGAKLKSLKLEEIERNKKLRDLNEQRSNYQVQLNGLSSRKDYPEGEVLVRVDAKKAGKYRIELSYLVNNAGWFPSYDIRAGNIDEPVELIYKANVRQDTKVDWKNVKLKFSSSDPNVSGTAPELNPYFLSYNMLPPSYSKRISSVSGMVFDAGEGTALPGASVVVDGTTIGTVTGVDGRYSITLPQGAGSLAYSYIGYDTQVLPVHNSTMNVGLSQSLMQLEEVVVGYATRSKKESRLDKAAAEPAVMAETSIRGVQTLAVPSVQVENQTTVDFDIKTPYSILSDNKSYSVDMAVYSIPANFQYVSVPKIQKDAFLIAGITGWEKYNLLEGEANIFFEGTYIGKTLLDVRYAADTLNVSLGRDKNVVINREKISDFTTKQFIGTKKEESRGWKITVKNNKSRKIKIVISDQVPVSMLEEIEVDLQKSSGGKLNDESGELTWEIELDPGKSKELELKYSVKYPKNKTLVIE